MSFFFVVVVAMGRVPQLISATLVKSGCMLDHSFEILGEEMTVFTPCQLRNKIKVSRT